MSRQYINIYSLFWQDKRYIISKKDSITTKNVLNSDKVCRQILGRINRAKNNDYTILPVFSLKEPIQEPIQLYWLVINVLVNKTFIVRNYLNETITLTNTDCIGFQSDKLHSSNVFNYCIIKCHCGPNVFKEPIRETNILLFKGCPSQLNQDMLSLAVILHCQSVLVHGGKYQNM